MVIERPDKTRVEVSVERVEPKPAPPPDYHNTLMPQLHTQILRRDTSYTKSPGIESSIDRASLSPEFQHVICTQHALSTSKTSATGAGDLQVNTPMDPQLAYLEQDSKVEVELLRQHPTNPDIPRMTLLRQDFKVADIFMMGCPIIHNGAPGMLLRKVTNSTFTFALSDVFIPPGIKPDESRSTLLLFRVPQYHLAI
eukprot:IDg16808t1